MRFISREGYAPQARDVDGVADGRETMVWGSPMLRRAGMVSLAIALLLVASACGASTNSISRAGKTAEVTALDNSFNPSTLVVAPGTTVKWTNKGKLEHNSLSVSGDEKIEVQPQNFDPGESFEHTFTKPGTYKYY